MFMKSTFHRARNESKLAKLNLVALAVLAVTLFFSSVPRAGAQATLLNRRLAGTDFQTQPNPITASCNTMNCTAPPRRIFPLLNAVCPAGINGTCTFYIHLESQDLTLSQGDTGLFRFFVDGAPPNPGPTDPLGFFAWDNNDPFSATAEPASHSYAVVAIVTNAVPNQVHPIDVRVSCIDINAGGCTVATGLSSLEVNIYTP